MRVRWIGVALVLVVAGAAVGYGVASQRGAEPTRFSGPEPVAAVSPSYPAEPVDVLPDPDFPRLEPGLPLHRVSVGSPPFGLTIPVPQHWVRSTPTAGEWRWYPPGGLTVPNIYFLRLRLVANQYQPVSAALSDRIQALRGAANVEDFHLESQTSDGFVADYVSDGHRRLTMERYVARAGSDTAYAWIALIGREADRRGMADAFDRILRGVRA